jgi:hypothetical protein
MLRVAFWFLVAFSVVLVIQSFRLIAQPDFTRAGLAEHLAIYLVLTPLFAFQLAFTASQFRRNNQSIIEFECDETALQFRKLGDTHKETRPLSEIVRVYKWRGLGHPVGYRLAFRDGSTAYVNYSLSNAKALEARLKDACVPAHSWLEILRKLRD